MATKLKQDWQPSDRVAELVAHRFGIRKEEAREFIGSQLPGFKLYWMDTGGTKESWDTTCYNWMIRSYEDQKELQALHRSLVPKQGNMFEAALAMVTNKDNPPPAAVPRQHKVVHTPIPGEGETMCTEDALAALAGMRN